MIDPVVQKGSLLIATPEIEQTLFSRCVILVCETSSSGSFGLIINKPLDMQIPEDIIDPESIQNQSISIRAGGPIEPAQMMLVHSNSDQEKISTLKISEGIYLGGDLNFLQESVGKTDGPSILICFGYVGWGPTALEQEIQSGAWILSEANSNYLFNLSPSALWKQALKDLGGRFGDLALLPDDLSLN